MLMRRLVWTVLQWRLGDRGTPSWFRARVFMRLQSMPFREVSHKESKLVLILTMITMVVAGAEVGAAFHLTPGAFWWIIIPCGVSALFLSPLLARTLVAGLDLWMRGRMEFLDAMQDVLSGLSSHERMDYRASTRRQDILGMIP